MRKAGMITAAALQAFMMVVMTQPYPQTETPAAELAEVDPAQRLAEIDAAIEAARAERKNGGEGLTRQQYKSLMNEKGLLSQQMAALEFADWSDEQIEAELDSVQNELASAQVQLKESGERLPYDQWRAFADKEKQLTDAISQRRDEATVRRLKELRKDPAAYLAQISTAGSMHTYSIGNVISFLIERDGVSRVANRNAWEERGMSPKEGERALWVNTPIFKSTKRKGPDGKWIAKIDPATGRQAVDASGKKLWEEKQTRVGFKYIRGAWDISQMEIVDPMKHAQASVAEQQRLEDVYDHYVGVLAKDGVRVLVAGAEGTDAKYNVPFTVDGGIRGFYSPEDKVIVLAPGRTIHQLMGTFLHELSHHVLEHKNSPGDDKDTYAVHEMEAETLTAYLIGRYGVKREYSEAYRASWMSKLSDKQIMGAMHKARKVAHKMHGKSDDLTLTQGLDRPSPVLEHAQQTQGIGW